MNFAEPTNIGNVIFRLACHPERSEGSAAMGREILRFAQDDIPDVDR